MALFPASAPVVPGPVGGAAHEAAPWIRRLARMGYAAKGVVYVVVGILATQAALTPVEDPDSSSGALRAILDQPFGKVVLAIVAAGLAGYVVWRLVQAIADPEHKGSDAKGIATRLGYALSGLLYAALALESLRLLAGRGGASGGGGGGEQRAEHWTAVVMAQPLGRVAVGAVGAGIIAFGLFELYRAFAGNLRKRLGFAEVSEGVADHIVRFGRCGYAARGVVFGIIGWFLVQAALQYDSREATDLAGALTALRAQSHGPILLGIIALGLIAYGLWQLAVARYRHIRAPGS